MRKALSVVVGFVAMLVTSALLFTGLYEVVGPEVAFKRASYEISPLMATSGLAIALIAGAVGWAACRAVGGPAASPTALLLTVVVLSLLTGLPMLLRDKPAGGRAADLPRFRVMMSAWHPWWCTIGTPVAQAAGVWIASRRSTPSAP